MKRHCLPAGIALLTLFSCKVKKESRYFTGTIVYVYTYSSDSLNADSIAATRQLKAFFRYDESDYVSRFINPDTITYYYSGKRNKCISETNSRKNYECEDYSLITDSVLSFRMYDTGEKILGHTCRVLEIQKKNALLVYWFSTDLKMAPATYSWHRSYNWDFYGEKSDGGIILKSEVRFGNYTKKGVATEVARHDKGFKALEIDDKLFSEACR